MADNVDYQTSALATAPNATKVATIETASSGHVQRNIIGGGPTATLSNVNASATNVTVLASNTDRMGAAMYNDSNARVMVKCGATASATSFTIAMSPFGYWEVPFGYTGIIDGIWDSATGVMRVTEFT